MICPGSNNYRKRAAFQYEMRMDSAQKEALKLKAVDFKTAWHLMDVVTDPSEEGKGVYYFLCSV